MVAKVFDGYDSKKIKLIIAVFSFFIAIIVGISTTFIVVNNIIPNVIKNLDQYMAFLSNDDKRTLQDAFGSFLKESFEINSLPSDIIIRDGSYSESNEDGFGTASFIVDVDSLKISYQVYFSYPSSDFTSENPIINCPALADTKYPETDCVGMYNSTKTLKMEQSNPIYNKLPIVVDDFDADTGLTTRFDIRGFFDEVDDKFYINIVDYSCGNYDKAIKMIRDYGFNPEDYAINYKNECIFDSLPYTGVNLLGNKYSLDYTYTNDNKLYFLINNYSCGNKNASEQSTLQAVTDWLLLHNFNIKNYEYGTITLCNN